jgi:hypothetical protein
VSATECAIVAVIDWSLELPALLTTHVDRHRVYALRDVFEVHTFVALAKIVDQVSLKPRSGSLSILLM